MSTALKNMAMIMLTLCSLVSFNSLSQEIFSSRHHVVFVKPSEQITVPKAFELSESGSMICSTCHEDDAFKKWKTGQKNLWLKDLEPDRITRFNGGPYQTKSDFCMECHSPKPMARDNIHNMLNDQRKPIESKCEYCHEKVPETKSSENGKSLRELMETSAPLRLPADKICVGCHLQTPHLNAQAHQVEVVEPMLDRLVQYQKDHDIYLPLIDINKVMCITCHSPHQKGVLDSQSPAGKQVGIPYQYQAVEYEASEWAKTVARDKRHRLSSMGLSMEAMPFLNYQKIKHESLMRLPAKDGALCLVCHEFDR